MKSITKWDKGRALLLWWSNWTLFTINNAIQACRRSGVWVVVGLVKSNLVWPLEHIWWWYKILWFDYNDSYNLESLIMKSNTIWLWFWLEDDFQNAEIKKFYIELLNKLPNPSVIDADLILFIKNNKNKIKFKNKHILTLNIKETDLYFWTKNPDNNIIIAEAKELNVWFVLKNNKTTIISPCWNTTIIDTDLIPEMTTAWMWDILTWLITWFLAQGYDQESSIIVGIKTRELAAKNYLEENKDIIVLPEDVILNIPLIIKNLIKFLD